MAWQDGRLNPLKETFKFYARVAGKEALKNAEEADQFG